MESSVLARQPLPTSRARTAVRAKRDLTAWGAALVATIMSVVAYVTTVRLHGVLLYVDSISHLEIARRVVSSTSPGLAQLGYVWLPLPHLLMLPLVWITPLYRNGFAGSVVSMVACVATAVLIYKISFRLTRSKFAGVEPKACNFAYGYATGAIVTIFDAEDRPEPDQLLTAVAGFRAIRGPVRCATWASSCSCWARPFPCC